MNPSTLWWVAFVGFVCTMLALDLGVFHRKAHAVKIREALIWVGVWVTLALLFNLGIYLGWIGSYPGSAARQQAALEFFTGYLIELSLSVDNVFVFALLFSYFQVPPRYQHRVLFWGILGALVMRGGMVFAGVALLDAFHWVIYVFGAILILGGIKMWRSHGVKIEPEKNPVLGLVRRFFRVAPGDHGQSFFVRENGVLAITPLFIVLIFVEWTDLIFAIDSIPAVLAVTRDPFIVLTSNVMAILGLRSLYFALADVMKRFHLLHYGLAAILIFVGTKMLLVEVYKVPTIAALGVVAGILVVSVVASIFRRPPPSGPPPGTEATFVIEPPRGRNNPLQPMRLRRGLV
ncbi:MAG: TerC family protein [Chthoniobacterales bacterium]